MNDRCTGTGSMTRKDWKTKNSQGNSHITLSFSWTEYFEKPCVIHGLFTIGTWVRTPDDPISFWFQKLMNESWYVSLISLHNFRVLRGRRTRLFWGWGSVVNEKAEDPRESVTPLGKRMENGGGTLPGPYLYTPVLLSLRDGWWVGK